MLNAAPSRMATSLLSFLISAVAAKADLTYCKNPVNRFLSALDTDLIPSIINNQLFTTANLSIANLTNFL